MMHIETLPIEQLRPAPYNPRVTLKRGSKAYTRLARSLAEFDLVLPIVWNRTTGHIVGGHQRVAILQDQGVQSVECVVVELPLEREKALNVALNNAQVGGDWDLDKLQTLIGDLQSLPDFDATLTGFDAKDLSELLLTPVSPAAEVPPVNDDEGLVRVAWEVSVADWEAVRQALDLVLAEHPTIRLHVRLPSRKR